MASLKAFRDAFKAAVLADADVSAWAQTWFSRALTVVPDVQAGQVNDDEKPALVIGRARAAAADEPQVGNLRANKVVDLPFEILWIEGIASKANDQHVELHDALSRMVLRNRDMGAAAAIGLVEGEAGETQQPAQAFSGAIRAEYGITA